jgi:hypothetical protein
MRSRALVFAFQDNTLKGNWPSSTVPFDEGAGCALLDSRNTARGDAMRGVGQIDGWSLQVSSPPNIPSLT